MLAPGIVVTLWHGNGIARAFADGVGVVSEARPAVVMLHAGVKNVIKDFAKAAADVRAILPGVEIWAGIGVDGWLDGRRTAAVTAAMILRAGYAATAGGATRVIWNGEAAYKIYVETGRDVARIVTTEFARNLPLVPQGFTSFDHPMYHPQPWRSWCYVGTPVVDAWPQVYAAPGHHVMAHRGALPRREATSMASFAEAVRRGWIAGPDHLAWRPYVQAHSNQTTDTVSLALRHEQTAFWAAPTRIDVAGSRALLGACELARRGFSGPTAIKDAQTQLGLRPDGVYGPLTAGAIGLNW